MIKLNFTNSTGKSIELFSAPFRLSKVEGLGDVEAEIQMLRAPFQQGSTFVDALLMERHISVELTITGKDEVDLAANRRLFSEVFNPILGLGLLTYTDKSGSKQILAVPESVPAYPDGPMNRGRWFQKVLLFLVCPNPYWQDINPTNVKLEDYVSNFSFPFSFPVSFATRGDMRTLVNNGHAPAPVKITFVGESVNPKITKVDTGEFIRVKRTIPEGYSLVITTGFDDKAVRIIAPDGVESNAMGYIDLNSTFFSLDIGENKLSFITDGGKPDVYVEYRNQYLGV